MCQLNLRKEKELFLWIGRERKYVGYLLIIYRKMLVAHVKWSRKFIEGKERSSAKSGKSGIENFQKEEKIWSNCCRQRIKQVEFPKQEFLAKNLSIHIYWQQLVWTSWSSSLFSSLGVRRKMLLGEFAQF